MYYACNIYNRSDVVDSLDKKTLIANLSAKTDRLRVIGLERSVATY